MFLFHTTNVCSIFCYIYFNGITSFCNLFIYMYFYFYWGKIYTQQNALMGSPNVNDYM